MAFYGGSSGRGKNIVGMNKVRADLKNLQDDLVANDATSTKAGRGVNSILHQGAAVMRDEYLKANSTGVEHTDHVYVGSNFLGQGWGARLFATGIGLFFAEFGSGVNLNSGTSRGAEFGYTPKSWSLGEAGKGYLDGGRYAVFQGWWPVKKRVPGAEMREFTTANGTITRRVKQGNAPVNAAEVAAKTMHDVAARTMKHFFEVK